MNRTQGNILLSVVFLGAVAFAGIIYVNDRYIAPEAPPVVVNTNHGPVTLKDEKVSAGDLLTAPDLGTIYYLNDDLERVVFPDEQTFLSWYENFDDVKFISREKLESFPLSGRNATIRAGTLLVTIQSSPQVWLISHPNGLHWLKGGEEQVVSYIGENWQERLVDLPEYYIANYVQSVDLEDTRTYPAGMFVHAKSNDAYYLVTPEGQRQVTLEGMAANRLQKRFVLEIDEPLELPLGGPPLKEYEPRWSSPDVKEQEVDPGPQEIEIGTAEGQVG